MHYLSHVSCAQLTWGIVLAEFASHRADRRRHASALVIVASLAAAMAPSSKVCADPWLAPGDLALRHDIQLLADAGILRGPVTTWPLSWPDIARDVLGARELAPPDSGLAAALSRVQRRAQSAAALGSEGIDYEASVASDPIGLRHFADTPREDAELGLRISWLGSRLAANVQVAVVADPADDKEFRYDGSYVGVNLGNFMISAGAMERWWGPGYEGSLILSNNSRPIPSITVERNYTDPFESKWLSWIGPWRASIALGRAEGSGVALPNTRYFAARVNFRPRPWLELALTRTAQWCGDGRPCSLGTFGDLLIGRDNRSDSLTVNQEPGNQLAGYDVRLRSPWRALPLAVYGQFIGEDEAGGLPSKFLGLIGAEWWGATEWGSYRVHAEAADTACAFSRADPQFGCAYRNGLYPQGYTYRGRVIGHSMDQDSRMYSLGATLIRPGGDAINALLRETHLNRDGGGNFVAAVPATIRNVELQYSRALWTGQIQLGVGYDDADDNSVSSGARGFVSWRQPL